MHVIISSVTENRKAVSNEFELSRDRSSIRKRTSYKGALMIFAHNHNADHPGIPNNINNNNNNYNNNNLNMNVLSDLVVEPLRLQVAKYVEYLFGDVNFPKDNHLQRLARQNKDGFVPLLEIMKFPRMRKMCTDRTRVVEWLSQSDVVVCSEDGNYMRRRKPLPELRKVVYAKDSVEEGLVDPPTSFTVMTYSITHSKKKTFKCCIILIDSE